MLPIGFPIPTIFDINQLLKRVRFFLGDRWVDLGEIRYEFVKTNENNGYLNMQIPDIELFIESREKLDDGTADWSVWGPRVN